MIIVIAFIISLLIVFPLIKFIAFPIDKKPLYIVTIIAGAIVLFAIFLAQSMSVFYGLLSFVGLLLASAILLGKKREWIVKFSTQDNTNNRNSTKSFKLDWKEEGNGRSLYDEEYHEIFERKDFVQRQRTQKEQKLELVNILPTQNASTQAENNENNVDEQMYTNILTTEMYFDETNSEIEETESFYEMNDNTIKLSEDKENSFDINQDHELNTSMIGHKINNQFVGIEDEELSDDWLNHRLNALYGVYSNSEEVASTTYLNEAEDYRNNSFKGEQITEFEDISKLYFSDERGGNDGTT